MSVPTNLRRQTPSRVVAAHDVRLDQIERAAAAPAAQTTRQLQDVGGPSALSNRQRYAYDYATGKMVPVPPDPVSFTWSTLTVEIGKNGWQDPDGGGNIIGIGILLTGTGTSTTTCRLRKNGAIIGVTASVGSGVHTSGPVYFSSPVPFGGPLTDYLQAEITAAGTGASGLTVSALRG